MHAAADAYAHFLVSRRADLRRIASRTNGDHSVEDVHIEAWLTADQISRRRGWAVDFLNVDDQELLLSWLYGKLVRYAEKNVRFAIKLDRDWNKEDADSALDTLARLLTAPERFDPLVQMLDEEQKFDPLALTRHSYSQASAYVILLHRFEWDFEALAAHLRLVAVTVKAKVAASGVHMRLQPSLFDRITTVDPDFLPTIARRARCTQAVESGQVQLAWRFSGSTSGTVQCRRRSRAMGRSPTAQS